MTFLSVSKICIVNKQILCHFYLFHSCLNPKNDRNRRRADVTWPRKKGRFFVKCYPSGRTWPIKRVDKLTSWQPLHPRSSNWICNNLGPRSLPGIRRQKHYGRRGFRYILFCYLYFINYLLCITQAIGSWFRNNKPFKEKIIFKLEKKLSLRRVIAREKAEELHAKVLEDDPDIKKGSTQYLGKFQKVLSSLMESMSAECKAEMEGERAKWEKEGPPLELRLKWANF